MRRTRHSSENAMAMFNKFQAMPLRKLSRDSSLGSGLAWREFSGRAGSAYVDWRFVNGQGQAGLRLEHSFGLGRPDNTELSYDQDWRMPLGWSLSTSLGAVVESADPSNGLPGDTLLKAAVSLNGRLGNRANAIDGRFLAPLPNWLKARFVQCHVLWSNGPS